MIKKLKARKRIRSYLKYIHGELHDNIISEHNDAGDLRFIYVVSTCIVSPHVSLDNQIVEWLKARKDSDWSLVQSREKEAMFYADNIIKRIKLGEDIDKVSDEIESAQITKTVGIAQNKQELKKLLTMMCFQEQDIILQVGNYEVIQRGYELDFFDELVGDMLILHCSLC